MTQIVGMETVAANAVAQPEVRIHRRGSVRSHRRVPGRGVVVVGTGPAAQAMADAIRRQPDRGWAFLGFVDDQPPWHAPPRPGMALLGAIGVLPDLVERYRADAVLVEHLHAPDGELLLECVDRGAHVITFNDMHERLEGRVSLEATDAAWLLQALGTAEGPAYSRSKRALDVAFALVGLAFTMLLLPLIALAIKLGGGAGPVLYSQVRVGHRGRAFRIWKFRTMRQDAEVQGIAWATVDDCRVTPVGRFLRQSRIDELPQFWNVLRGDMSLVGPRPERPEFVAMLATEVPFYGERHLVMPGVTGWAQVMYPYGASVDDAREKHQYDLFYLKHRSLAMDLGIMARTVKVMVNKVGGR